MLTYMHMKEFFYSKYILQLIWTQASTISEQFYEHYTK